MNLRISILGLCVCIILMSGCGKSTTYKFFGCHGGNRENKGDLAVAKNDGPIELLMTKEEIAASVKWKDKSMFDLVLDAHKLDKGALYTLGVCILMGHGCAIDVELANSHFAESASFGFAPALDQLRITYAEEGKPFLSLVYFNLIVSEGHSEFLKCYHEIRSKLSASANKIAQEIERIAIRKKMLIQKNIDVFKKCPEANENGFLDHRIENITKEDLVFDDGYWENILRGITPSDTEFILLEAERNLEKNKSEMKRLEAYRRKNHS